MDGSGFRYIELRLELSKLSSKLVDEEEEFYIRRKDEWADESRESSQAGGNVSKNLNSGRVEVVDIGSRGIDVNDPCGVYMIPDRWVVLDG